MTLDDDDENKPVCPISAVGVLSEEVEEAEEEALLAILDCGRLLRVARHYSTEEFGSTVNSCRFGTSSR
jgi:predicted TIM-barrel enzyme